MKRPKNFSQKKKEIATLNHCYSKLKQYRSMELKLFFALQIELNHKFLFIFFIITKTSLMMFLNSFKSLIYHLDMFCSSQLLRYNSQTQYKTLTGGMISLAIICVVVVDFTSMVVDTLNRVTITSSLVKQKVSDPVLTDLQTGSEGIFMLGFSIQSFDLSQIDLANGPQYFSFVLDLGYYSGLQTGFSHNTSLQQCTQKHWSVVPKFQANYESFFMNQWLCLPIGVSLPMQGTFSSSVYKQIMITAYPCENQTSHNTCAPQEEIDSFMNQKRNFYLTLYYVNPVINPDQQDFISYYVQANDYVIFSSQIGSQAWMYFSDYSITTDDSIFPYKHITTIKGSIVQQKLINHPFGIINASSDAFARIYFAKSENSLTFTRQVQKISAVISYIGGLVGAITAVLFLIKSYTDTSLQIAIGLSLFEARDITEKQEKQKHEQEDKWFNLFGFLRLASYRLLKFCGWKNKSDRQQYLQECQNQAIKQMDIELLLRRLIKLQICISNFFTSQSLQKIKEEQPITLSSAKKMRQLLLKQESEHDKAQKAEIKCELQLNNAFASQNLSDDESYSDSVVSMQKTVHVKPKYPFTMGQQKFLAKQCIQGFFEQKRPKSVKFQTTQKGGSRNRVQPVKNLPPINNKIVRLQPKQL